jgi:hypothetical protein
MNRSLQLLRFSLSFGVVISCSAAFAEVYAIQINKRMDKDLYSAKGNLIIVTKYCHHYSYGERAVLKYEDYSYNNSIIFDDGTKCDVEKILKK